MKPDLISRRNFLAAAGAVGAAAALTACGGAVSSTASSAAASEAAGESVELIVNLPGSPKAVKARYKASRPTVHKA